MKGICRVNTKFIRRVIILLFIVTSIFVASCKKLFPQITPEEAEEVKNICSDLKPPPFFAKTHQTDDVKSHAALRSIQYSSLAPPEQVEEYYVNLLTKSGWSYRKENEGSTYLRFKKGKYAINVEFQEFSITEKKIYSVGCSTGLW